MKIHKNSHIILLINFLFCVGTGVFLYRWLKLDVPLVPTNQTDTWTIEAKIDFHANKEPVKIEFILPAKVPGYGLLDENFVTRNYGVTINDLDNFRESIWAIRHARGPQNLFYRTVIYRIATKSEKVPKNFLEEKTIDLQDSEKAAITSILDEIRLRSADTATFVAETIKIINDENNKNTAILLGRKKDSYNKCQIIRKILSQANVPAHVLQGLYLNQIKPITKLVPWIAVIIDEQWSYFNPNTGSQELPKDFFIWSYDQSPLIKLTGGSHAQVTFSVAQNKETVLQLLAHRNQHHRSKLLEFSLSSLPLPTQQVYKVLLTVPIGALVILLLRSFIGMETFGTFMPVLLALAFRDSGLFWGIFLFVLVVGLGLIVRFYFDKLHLLLVPRLSSILTLVILLMVVISIVSNKLGVQYGLSIALFPMVILTMIIERTCIMWEERGARATLITGGGSLLAACLAYLVMENTYLSYLMFAFPECLLIVLAIILIVSLYRGYRLLELYRFRSLAQDD